MARPKGIPFAEENASSNYAEFSVVRRPDRKIRMQRLLLVLAYVAFAAVYGALFLIVWKMAPLIAILPLLLFILWLVTWRFTKIEYTYIVCQGQFHIYRVNGFNKAKEVFVAKIAASDGIYPAADAEYASAAAGCSVLDYSVGKGTEDRYFAVFPADSGRVAVYFTAAAKLLGSLRYYGGEKVVVTYVSR